MEQEIRQALKTARQNGDRPIRSDRKSKREDLSGLFNSTIIHRREMSSMIPHFLNRDLARSVIVLLLNSSVLKVQSVAHAHDVKLVSPSAMSMYVYYFSDPCIHVHISLVFLLSTLIPPLISPIYITVAPYVQRYDTNLLGYRTSVAGRNSQFTMFQRDEIVPLKGPTTEFRFVCTGINHRLAAVR